MRKKMEKEEIKMNICCKESKKTEMEHFNIYEIPDLGCIIQTSEKICYIPGACIQEIDGVKKIIAIKNKKKDE
jgi:hypothetical protein